MIRLIFFDLDNTLIDSLALLKRLYLKMVEEFGFLDRAPPFEKIFRLSLAEIGALFHEKEKISAFYKAELSKIEVPMSVGAASLLSFLKAQEVEMILVSSAPLAWIDKHLDHHQIRRYFSAVYSGDKRMYIQKALEEKKIDPKEALLIDDVDIADICIQRFSPDFETFKKWWWSNNYHKIDFVQNDSCEKPYSRSREEEIQAFDLFEEKKKDNPQLFNGPVFFYEGFEEETLLFSRGDYKDFLLNWFRNVRGRVPMAVAGRIYHRDRLLVGRRSRSVVVYPGFLELVPQGVLSVENPKEQFLLELREEAGISLEQIASCNLKGLYLDRRTHLCEWVFDAELKTDEIVQSDETTELFFATRSEIEEKVEELVPFSHFLFAESKGNE